MPDDRMLHRCQGHSAKLAQCDHLTYRVWNQYLLSADDYGVMPDIAALVRGANLALMREAEDEIRRCLDLLLSLGLVLRFSHQGQPYLCSEKWQDFQKVSYPRTSYYPSPTSETFGKLSVKTRKLFAKKCKAKGGDGHRLTANGLRLTASTSSEGVTGEAATFGPAELAALWNEAKAATDFPSAQKPSGAIRKHAAARLAEHPAREWWDAYFGRIVASDFLCARSARKPGHESWRPSFDWVLMPANVAKVESGQYDNRTSAAASRAVGPSSADDGWFDECQRLHGGQCNGSRGHRDKMQIDAIKQEVA